MRKIIRCLHKGYNSSVHLCSQNGIQNVIKKFNNDYNYKLELNNHNTLVSFPHGKKHIINIDRYNHKEREIVMPKMDDDLNIFLNRHYPFRYTQSMDLYKKIAKSVNFMHHHGFSHNDIKLENILIDSVHKIKLCDFEHADKNKNSHCSDMWSVGVVFYQIAYGSNILPYYLDQSSMKRSPLDTYVYKIIDHSNPIIKEILNNLLTSDVDGRWTSGQLVNHLNQIK